MRWGKTGTIAITWLKRKLIDWDDRDGETNCTYLRRSYHRVHEKEVKVLL